MTREREADEESQKKRLKRSRLHRGILTQFNNNQSKDYNSSTL
jgi:hypothetical protein